MAVGNTLDEVIAVLSEYVQGEVELVADTPLESAGIDSLAVVEIMFELEDRYGIRFPQPENIGEQFQQFDTPARIAEYVQGLVEEKP